MMVLDKNRCKGLLGCNKPNIDRSCIELGPLKMKVCKEFYDDTPNEITVVVPRVEIREVIEGDRVEREYIYNSVTIVNSPIREPVDSINRIRPMTGSAEILQKIGWMERRF